MEQADSVLKVIIEDYYNNLGLLDFDKYPQIDISEENIEKTYLKKKEYQKYLSYKYITSSQAISNNDPKKAMQICLELKKSKIPSDKYACSIFYHSILSLIHFSYNSYGKCANELDIAIKIIEEAISQKEHTTFNENELILLKYIHKIKLVAISGSINGASYWETHFPDIKKKSQLLKRSPSAELLLTNYTMQDHYFKGERDSLAQYVSTCDSLEQIVENKKILKTSHMLKSYYYRHISNTDKALEEAEKAKKINTYNETQQLNIDKIKAITLYQKNQIDESLNAYDSLITKKLNYAQEQSSIEINRFEKNFLQNEAETINAKLVFKKNLIASVILGLFAIIITIGIYFINKRTFKLKTKNEELNVMIKKIETQAQTNAKFLYNMGHELRTPLNSIIGFSSLLLDNENIDKNDKNQYSEIISNSSASLLNILDDILIEADDAKITYNIIKCDLVSICNNTILSFNKTIQSKVKFIFKTNLTALYADTDPFRLAQVLNNLLSNSYRYTNEGFISIELKKRNNEALIIITDTGTGIADSDKANLFERNKTGKNKLAGTGLGLSIAKSVITHLGGKIWIDNEYQNGAKFYITHPLIKL